MVASERILSEGKTKIIRECESNPKLVVIESKDNITAGDGAKRDIIPNKAKYATNTACNVFRLLKECGIPVAFTQQIDERHFVADKCKMIQYEVVVRREAHGSYLKRHPYLKKGQVFPKLITEFFLKTNDKKWQEYDIPCDDPYIVFDDEKSTALLYRPDEPIYNQKPFLTLNQFPLNGDGCKRDIMINAARRAFLILEKCWQLNNGRLVDFKVEFGMDCDGNLLLADVIDNDSWRVIRDNSYIDKQVYRDGGNLSTVEDLYRQVSEITNNFRLPKQTAIVWRASPFDDINQIYDELQPYLNEYLKVECITKSLHKQPVDGYIELQNTIQNNPDSVVIALVGRSNGAGPILSAATTVPVITIPNNYTSFSEDVWSSLRTPRETPVMTVLETNNAVLASLQILAMRNPLLYSQLRQRQEKRLTNIFTL